jgi:hypothetical protein
MGCRVKPGNDTGMSHLICAPTSSSAGKVSARHDVLLIAARQAPLTVKVRDPRPDNAGIATRAKSRQATGMDCRVSGSR